MIVVGSARTQSSVCALNAILWCGYIVGAAYVRYGVNALGTFFVGRISVCFFCYGRNSFNSIYFEKLIYIYIYISGAASARQHIGLKYVY